MAPTTREWSDPDWDWFEVLSPLIYLIIYRLTHFYITTYLLSFQGHGSRMRWDLCAWCWSDCGAVVRTFQSATCAPDMPSPSPRDGPVCVSMSCKLLTCRKWVCTHLFLDLSFNFSIIQIATYTLMVLDQACVIHWLAQISTTWFSTWALTVMMGN